ncbi:MAG TPA: WecB/TagA/CpsF family glycosyltransferase [Opitutaceae bacterium]|nr:WecB/TagA/CpsF family glycosyltransferase [Opitutaceae bacterium]
MSSRLHALPFPSAAPASAAPPAGSASVAAAPANLPVSILGVAFDPLTLSGTVDRIGEMIAAGESRYIVTPNVDFLVQAQRDEELHGILAQADVVLCDGRPLVWASHWLGNMLPERVAGSDLVPLLLQRAEERGWRIFLLGGAPGVGAEAARRIAATHPSLPAVEHYSPPFRPLAEMNNAEIVARVRAARPDIVLVCFGCPKQEKWIFRHHRELGAPVTIGAGGTIDFLAGRLRRAPPWMRRSGTEWLFRLAQEPRRLFRRYADNLLHFLPALVAQRVRLPPSPGRSRTAAPTCASTLYGLKIEVAGRLDGDALGTGPGWWTKAATQTGHCVLDLSAVTAIDSTGLAFLAHWQRRLARHRRNLILLRPSPGVRAALAHMRLTGQFIITEGDPPGSPQTAGR